MDWFVWPAAWFSIASAAGWIGLTALGRARRAAAWKRLGFRGTIARGMPGGADSGWAWCGAGVCATFGLIAALGGRASATGGDRSTSIDPDDPGPGVDCVVALDVSRSMAARDVAPDRLGVARASLAGLGRLARENPGLRLGLVVFTERGAARVPPTRDVASWEAALAETRAGELGIGSTWLSEGVAAALDLLMADAGGNPSRRSKRILVASDGEDQVGGREGIGEGGNWESTLKASGIRIDALVVGGDVETELEDPRAVDPETGARGKTRRSAEPLRGWTARTGGRFFATAGAPLDLGSALAGELLDRGFEPASRDRARIWVVAAFACACAGLAGGLAGAGRFAGALFVGIAAATGIGAEPVPEDPARVYNEALGLFDAGRYDEAIAAFDRAERLPGGNAGRLGGKTAFGLGNARVMAGRFAEALDAYRIAEERLSAAGDAESLAILADVRINRAFASELVSGRRGDGAEDAGGTERSDDSESAARGESASGPGGESRSGSGAGRGAARGGGGGGEDPETELAAIVRGIEAERRARREALGDQVAGGEFGPGGGRRLRPW